MVVGSVSKIGRAYSLDSRMIDVETGELPIPKAIVEEWDVYK